jgi:EpsI family protein
MLFVTGLIANYLNYDIFNKADVEASVMQCIPKNLGPWQGTDVKMEDLIYELLETKSIIHRTYQHTDNGQQVFLSLVYYPETKVDFHAPEACLGGKGIEIKKSSRTITLKSNGKTVVIDLNQLIWKKGSEVSLVYYFYKAGNFIGENYIKLRFSLALNKFSNNEKSGSLIRVSTPIKMNDKQEASKTLISFIRDLYPCLTKYL